MSKCPCGSGKTFARCCEPYLTGNAQAPTAEAQMRARYTAYTTANMAFIESTHSPKTRDSLELESSRKWAEESEWLGLEIVSTDKGGTPDTEGTVEFIARYIQDGHEEKHHEISSFVKDGGRWYFMDGGSPRQTVVREEPKIGRNDPCPCGSGKKYKKCCG